MSGHLLIHINAIPGHVTIRTAFAISHLPNVFMCFISHSLAITEGHHVVQHVPAHLLFV
jgi:hypothetical protein